MKGLNWIDRGCSQTNVSPDVVVVVVELKGIACVVGVVDVVEVAVACHMETSRLVCLAWLQSLEHSG